jgi:hypothetical protein
MFIKHVRIITLFHTHIADRMIRMLLMYVGRRILSRLKFQAFWDVMLSFADPFLVTSLMGVKQPELTSRTELAWLGMQHADEIQERGEEVGVGVSKIRHFTKACQLQQDTKHATSLQGASCI